MPPYETSNQELLSRDKPRSCAMKHLADGESRAEDSRETSAHSCVPLSLCRQFRVATQHALSKPATSNTEIHQISWIPLESGQPCCVGVRYPLPMHDDAV